MRTARVPLFILAVLLAGTARAAVVEVRTGDNIQTKLQGAQSGDTAVVDEAVFNSPGVINLSGKTNLTIVSRRLWDGSKVITDKPVVVETAWDAALGIPTDVARPTTRINLPRRDRGLFTDGCHGLKLYGIHFVGAGWRPTDTNDQYGQDCVFESTDGWAAIEVDGFKALNGPSTLSKRSHGLTLLRVATIDGGGSGINVSWTTNVRMTRCYSFRNNMGRSFNFLPGFCSQANDGKWYANVQNAGGGDKFSGCSDVVIFECVFRGSNGIQHWDDWLCDNISVINSYMGDALWKQFSYDACATQVEIVGRNILYRGCLFANAVIGSNVCESQGVTFEDCEWLGVSAAHRNIWDSSSNQIRNGGCEDITYTRAKFYNGAWFGWWLGFPHGEDMNDAYRAARRITGDKTAIFNAALPVKFKWVKNGTPTTQPVDPIDPTGPTSPNGTSVPPAPRIIDSAGIPWELTADGKIVRNRVVLSETNGVTKLAFVGGVVFQTAHGMWWRYSSGAWVVTTDPTATTQPVDPPPPPPDNPVVGIELILKDGKRQTFIPKVVQP
jgi:hypothetical protein